MFAQVIGINLSDRLFGQSSSFTSRTRKRVTKEETATKTWSGTLFETLNTASLLQKIASVVKSQPIDFSPTEGSATNNIEHEAPPIDLIDSRTTDDFKEECLSKHNYYREMHGVPPLTLSSKLCEFAQQWADHLATTESFYHRPKNKYGENLYMEWGYNPSGKVSGEKSVDSWYREIEVHKFGQEPTSLASGHFTQVIWKGSKELGVAYSRNKKGKTYVVANYEPAGNMMGRFSSNVPPPLG